MLISKQTAIRLMYTGKAQYVGIEVREGRLCAKLKRFGKDETDYVDISCAAVAQSFIRAANKARK